MSSVCVSSCRCCVFVSDASDDHMVEHQTDTACSWLVCHSRGDCPGEHCANCIHLPRLSGGPAAQFFGEASRASPQHGWRSAYSLREKLSPTQDQNQHKRPLHTRTQPPTLTKYTNSSIQHPQTRPPPLSLVHPPPKTPTSVQHPKTPTYTTSPPAPTLTPYTLDRIQPTRPDSPHISPSHKLPYVPTPAHSHTRNKQKTSKTKHKEIRILQLNANGIRSTVEELKHLLLTTQPDVVAVQESKLNPASRTPKIPNYTAIRTDRKHK